MIANRLQRLMGTGAWWGLGLAVALAIALRVPYLVQRSLWYDEASSWQTARFSFLGTVNSLWLNVHQPLYYWILRVWTLVAGDSVLALRGLSVLFGTLTVVGMYLTARECSRALEPDEAPGAGGFLPLATAWLVAANAFQINASIEARMYSLGTALTAFSAWQLVRLIARPASAWRWGAYTGLCILLLYVHHYCLFVVASQFAVLLVHGALRAKRDGAPGRRFLLGGIGAAAATGICYLPGLQLMLWQLGRVRHDYWTVPLSGNLVLGTFLEFLSPVQRFASPQSWALVVLCVFLGAALVVAYHARWPEGLVLALALLPMAMAAAATVAVSPIWEGRYFRFSQLFLLMLLPMAVRKLCSRPAARSLAAAGLVVLMALASVDFWRCREIPARPGMRGAMETILALHHGEEAIVAESNVHFFPAKYYAAKHAPVWLLETATREFWGGHLIRPADVLSLDDLHRSLRQGVWLLSHNETPASLEDLSDVVCDVQFQVPYDFGVPTWNVYVKHVRAANATAQPCAMKEGKPCSIPVGTARDSR